MVIARKRQGNGFTLIELLVVVAIIAMLLAVLLPTLSSAREKAKQSVCASQFRQLWIAHYAYAEDYNQYLVPARPDHGTFPQWHSGVDLGGVFVRYLPGDKLARDPFDPDQLREGLTDCPLLECPSDFEPWPLEKFRESSPMEHNAETSYGLNAWRVEDSDISSRPWWGAGGNRLDHITRPADTLLMAEIWQWYAIMDRVAVGTGTWDAHYEPHPTIPRYVGNLEWDDRERHGGVLNVLLVDGHVEDRTRDEGFPPAKENPFFWGVGYDEIPIDDPP